MKFVVYKNFNGMILRAGECPDDWLSSQANTGETAMEADADDANYYISGGSIAARPTLSAVWNKTTITANGADQAIFGSGLPNPTTVSVTVVPEGVQIPDPEDVTTGTFSFATPIAGAYTVIVTPPFPYIPVTQVITAT